MGGTMQLDYYRSPCEPEQVPAKSARRKKPALIVFLILIAVFLAGLILLRVLAPEGPLFSWEQMFPQLESSFPFDFPEELLPEGFRDEFEQPHNKPGLETPAENVKLSLPAAPTAPEVEMELHLPGKELSFQEIYAKVIPSIVSIEAYSDTAANTGTGVIMTADGYIVTNHHIIADRSEAYVILSDGREYAARLVGSDAESDLAVLKINAKHLTPAQFGSSNRVRVGDTVVAIGNPLGSELFGTMTEGIVSAINRDMNVDGYTMSLIQTTAALNPGNSGGALINTEGQVIGITNMKMMSQYETIEGLGFAIPTVWAKEVVDTLLDQGNITGRPTIGIMCFALTDGSAAFYGRDRGIYVDGVTKGSPAEKAGLQRGDVILTANGQELITLEQFTLIRDETGVGGTMHLTVWRDGETFETNLILVEQHELH